jgi:crossover junction endodeoxyribonuclease RuvC
VQGAIAMINSRLLLSPTLVDLPTKKRYNGRTALHGYATLDLLQSMIEESGRVFIGCEAIHAMPVNGAIGVFSQGSVTGALEAIFDILEHQHPNLQVRFIHPSLWKQHFGLIKASKQAARHKALELFAPAYKRLALAKHHNRAEAALIARYLWDDILQALHTDGEVD